MTKTNFFFNILFLIGLSLFLGACAKKDSTTRGVTKSQGRDLNPAVSQPSIQAASSQNLFYQLASVEAPMIQSDGSLTIGSYIKDPQNQYLPISTNHTSNQDAYGIYDDTRNGTKLDIRARCIGSSCDKYLLLVTVVKNGYAYHQMAALSFAQDCQFNLEQRNASVTQLYRSLDEFQNATSQIQARNDCVQAP